MIFNNEYLKSSRITIMNSSFLNQTILKLGYTNNALREICRYLNSIPFERKKNSIRSAISQDGLIMSISLLKNDSRRITYTHNYLGSSTVIVTHPKNRIEMLYNFNPETARLGTWFVLTQLEDFVEKNPEHLVFS